MGQKILGSNVILPWINGLREFIMWVALSLSTSCDKKEGSYYDVAVKSWKEPWWVASGMHSSFQKGQWKAQSSKMAIQKEPVHSSCHYLITFLVGSEKLGNQPGIHRRQATSCVSLWEGAICSIGLIVLTCTKIMCMKCFEYFKVPCKTFTNNIRLKVAYYSLFPCYPGSHTPRRGWLGDFVGPSSNFCSQDSLWSGGGGEMPGKLEGYILLLPAIPKVRLYTSPTVFMPEDSGGAQLRTTNNGWLQTVAKICGPCFLPVICTLEIGSLTAYVVHGLWSSSSPWCCFD